MPTPRRQRKLDEFIEAHCAPPASPLPADERYFEPEPEPEDVVVELMVQVAQLRERVAALEKS